MKTRIILLASVSILICGCAHVPKKSSLPAWQIEGNQIKDPFKPNVIYYFAGQWQVSRIPREPEKYVGFWISEDGGKNWDQRSSIPGFINVFAHPQTGLLYGIITEDYLYKRPDDGLLMPGGGRRLAISSDGQNWKDITPSAGVYDIFCIFPDPDHASRICVLHMTTKTLVLQATADDLSEWKSYSQDEWSRKHKGWNWIGFFAELEANGPAEAIKHVLPGSDWRERLRQKSHAELSRRNGHHERAFMNLMEVGNKESVPRLINALRWYPTFKIDGKEAAIDTMGMCIDALTALTGQKDFGWDSDKWEKWWKTEGKGLPPEHFQSRTANTAPDRTR